MASVSRILQRSCRRCKISTLATFYAQKGIDNRHDSLNTNDQDNSFPQFCSYSSDSSNETKILTHSTFIVQDGIDIEELPILIKRATSSSFPYLSHTYSGEKIIEDTEFDTTFRQDLSSCNSVNDVFKLLEVPSEKVRGQSASFALQRLHVLKYLNADWNQIHSFIRSAVMRELYDTVQRDVHLLPNSTLISLVECYLAVGGFSPMCIESLNKEIQNRLGDSTFSVEELLNLAGILKSGKDSKQNPQPFFSLKLPPVSIVSENSSRFLFSGEPEEVKVEHFDRYSSKTSHEAEEETLKKSQELLKSVWVHLTSRYQEINEHTLHVLLASLTRDNKCMVSLLDKPLANCWTSLSAEAVAVSLDHLVRLRTYNGDILKLLGQWALVNVHQMAPPLLLSYLNAFIFFGFLDENFVKAMERFLSLKGLLVPTDVIAMCVQYCRSCGHISPLVMDAAAGHFVQYAFSYQPLQLFVVLRAFGQLNYLPSQPAAFLKQVEACLWARVDLLSELQLLEILGSFTFVDILPRNFMPRFLSSDHNDRIKHLNPASKKKISMWRKLLRQAIALEDSQNVDKRLKWLFSHHHTNMSIYTDNNKNTVAQVRDALRNVVGSKYFYGLPIYGCYAVHVNGSGLPLEVQYVNGHIDISGQATKKLALLLRSVDHFTANTCQLLGAQASRLKQLHKLGFMPIEIRAGHFNYIYRTFLSTGATNFIRSCLQPHIDFSKFKCQDSPTDNVINDILGLIHPESDTSADTGDDLDD